MARKRTRNTGRKGRTRSPRRLPPLTPLELEVMDIVWELGDCTSSRVTEAFQRKRELAPTTIRTVLTKLRGKGYIEPIPSIGRGFVFRPRVKRETVARRSLKDLIASLFQGHSLQAIAYLLEETDIPDSELQEIRRKLGERRKRGDGQ